MKNGVFPATSVNKDVIPISDSGLKCEFLRLQAPRKKNSICNQAAVRLQPLPTMSSKELRQRKTQDTTPQTAEGHMKRIISVSPDFFTFPYIEKYYKFLILRYLVFFNLQKYFGCSDHLPSVANFYITRLPPLPPWSSPLRVT